MDEKFLNLEIRKFLKNFGITSQREIEIKIREALNNGSISENENLEVEANLNIGKINLTPQKTIVSASVFAAFLDKSNESPTKSAKSWISLDW